MPAETTLLEEPAGELDALRAAGRAAGQDPVKRKQIIDGARRVFIDMGFDAASMNDITRAAGVSKGTIYVYFANKEELFEALIECERQTIFANLYDALESGRRCPRDAAPLRHGARLEDHFPDRAEGAADSHQYLRADA